jgi:hypothetical protein
MFVDDVRRKVRAMTDQRRQPRYPADWVARYRFDRRQSWQDCRVLDLSRDGAALELQGIGTHRAVRENSLYLQIESVLGVPNGATLRADIRHCGRTSGGKVFVGIEFRELPAEQFRLLGLMAGLRSVG